MTIEETKSKLDILFSEVKAYRKSERFRELLGFCAQFKTLAPYNAMLVHLQMPHARFVLTPSDWKRYNRRIRMNARPLVILVPFGPVDFVFEIQNTYTPKDVQYSFNDIDIIEDVEKQFKVNGQVGERVLHRLIGLMQYHGVAYDPNMVAGVDMAAKINLLKEEDEHYIDLHINKNVNVIQKAKFLISTNRNFKNEQKVASIAHELGHLFCHHLPCPRDWGNAWEMRKLDKVAEEFEAESVARMVCDRLGVDNCSERYLASYLDSNKEIPGEVSVENICFAANKILSMVFASQKFTYRDGLLYKHDEKFRELLKSIKTKK